MSLYKKWGGLPKENYFMWWNMSLPPWAWGEKTIHRVETYWLMSKEKVQVASFKGFQANDEVKVP